MIIEEILRIIIIIIIGKNIIKLINFLDMEVRIKRKINIGRFMMMIIPLMNQ